MVNADQKEGFRYGFEDGFVGPADESEIPAEVEEDTPRSRAGVGVGDSASEVVGNNGA